VRIGTLLLAVPVGVYGCGALAVALEWAYTRGVAAAAGQPLYQVVIAASYTVDPLVEELVKVVPLLVVAAWPRVRRQWGVSDFVLLGAGCGAGFALLEALLRFSHGAQLDGKNAVFSLRRTTGSSCDSEASGVRRSVRGTAGDRHSAFRGLTCMNFTDGSVSPNQPRSPTPETSIAMSTRSENCSAIFVGRQR
jgi:hypothetical protein